MGDNPNKANQVGAATLPTRESVTQHQIAMLQGIIASLSPYLLGYPLRDPDTAPKLDGGVALSASLTFINVCTRIDEMLADKTRWSTEAHDRLYDSIAKVQAAQVTFLTEQAESAKSVRRPSFQLRPTLANDGQKIIAFYGDISRVGYAIIGMGNTPAEALTDFDRAFDRMPEEQVRMVAEAQGIPLEPITPTEPKPKRKKTE